MYLVCILYPVCSLHFVLTGLVLLFWFERASIPDRNIGARKKILVRLSWPLWLICGLYVEELTRKSTMIVQWLLYTNWRRKQMRGLPMWLLPNALSRGHSVCWNEPATGPLGVNISASRFKLHFQKFRKCDLRLLFLLTHINVLFLSTWAHWVIITDGDDFCVTVFYSVELSHTVIFNYGRLHFNEYLSVY